MQDNYKNIEATGMTCKTGTTGTTCKTDLSDFTFLFPLRIDSEERLANLNTVIKFISNHFITSYIVLEADKTRKVNGNELNTLIRYEFLEDKNEFFHKTKCINHLIRMAETKYVAVWDADVIADASQILDSATVIRTKNAGLSIPYDGRMLVCDKSLSDFFRSHPDIELLNRVSSSLPFMYGYHSTGGAVMVDKNEYLAIGGDNENFYGWGPEDVERVKRMEIMGIPVHFANGPIFHLWHPRGKTSWYLDHLIEKHNRKELIITCRKE
jgi:predicted glycosyltransferase involved in capsule biosynthesis